MVLDTNILIGYLNGDQQINSALSKWRDEYRGLYISSIVGAEILSQSRLTRSDIILIKKFLREFIMVPFDNQLFELCGFLRRSYDLQIPDAAIAATALYRGMSLVTRDKQFQKIKELLIIDL